MSFQADAFQNDAFQMEGVAPVVVAGAVIPESVTRSSRVYFPGLDLVEIISGTAVATLPVLVATSRGRIRAVVQAVALTWSASIEFIVGSTGRAIACMQVRHAQVRIAAAIAIAADGYVRGTTRGQASCPVSGGLPIRARGAVNRAALLKAIDEVLLLSWLDE